MRRAAPKARSRSKRTPLDRARSAYGRRAWANAYQSFLSADRKSSLEADDLELLASAAYLVGEDDAYLATLERAYNANAKADRCARASRCAFWLGFRLLMRGEMGRSSGWFARAERSLQRDPRECAERGYLLLPVVEQRIETNDLESAYRGAADAAAIGERCGDADLIACARHQQGRVRLRQGQIEAGLALLDETMVMVIGDELSPVVTGRRGLQRRQLTGESRCASRFDVRQENVEKITKQASERGHQGSSSAAGG